MDLPPAFRTLGAYVFTKKTEFYHPSPPPTGPFRFFILLRIDTVSFSSLSFKKSSLAVVLVFRRSFCTLRFPSIGVFAPRRWPLLFLRREVLSV